jgi:hypothetical protein
VIVNVNVNGLTVKEEGFKRSYEKKQRRPQLTSHLLVECCEYAAVIVGYGRYDYDGSNVGVRQENTHHSKQRRHDVVVAQPIISAEPSAEDLELNDRHSSHFLFCESPYVRKVGHIVQ